LLLYKSRRSNFLSHFLIRWIFGLEFCTPRYIIARELTLDKLRVGWGIRARRFEKKVKRGRAGEIVKLEGERRIQVEG